MQLRAHGLRTVPPMHSLRVLALAALTLGGATCFALPARAEDVVAESRWEPGVIPAINFDSDVGFGFGAVGTLARFEPGFHPYRLRLEAQVFMSVAIDEAGDASLPFHDDTLRVDVPGLLGGRLRLGGGLFFRKLATSGYYGIGQLSQERRFSEGELEASERARRYHHYDHLTAGVDAWARVALWRRPRSEGGTRLEWLTGLHGSFHEVSPYPGSKLAQDQAAIQAGSQRPELALLHGVGQHGLCEVDGGLVIDDRDHEHWPTRGTLTELSARAAGGGQAIGYGRLHAATRWFAPLHGEWLVFASRALADVIVGDAPVYELGAVGVMDRSDGPGGSRSVRGVAMGRLLGQAKVLANAELRAQAPWFTSAGERFRVGFVAFFDAGRVWSTLPPDAALDGPWAPFDAGLGGGLRLRWSETLIVRADGAYSPTRGTPGFYVDVGQAF